MVLKTLARQGISRPFAIAAVVVLLLILSGSAKMAFPDAPRVFDAAPRLVELSAAVHQGIRFDQAKQAGPRRDVAQTPAETAARRAGVAQDLVLLLMEVTKRDLGVEPRLAVVRVGPSADSRVVMEWSGRYYDPTLGSVYERSQVSVVRALAFGAALALAEPAKW